MLERLCVTLYLGRVFCRGVDIHLSSYPSLVFYLSKSKKLTPGDFWAAVEKLGFSLSIVDVPGGSLCFSTKGMAYPFAKVAPRRKQEKQQKLWGGGWREKKYNVIHQQREWILVLRSRGMMLERLSVTLYLGRVFCRGVDIHLSSYPSLVFYLSKSKKLTPGDFWAAVEKLGFSLSIVDVPGGSLCFSTKGMAYPFAKVAPRRKQEKQQKLWGGGWREKAGYERCFSWVCY